MAKFGKKNIIKDDLSKYNICVLGESGIGKTTLMVKTCEKLFGEDGYMIMNAGKEDGIDCIDNASYEDIPDFKTFDAFTKDIIANKKTDYPNLKVLVSDTLDQLFEIVEPEAVRKWNVENQGKKDFTLAKTLNQSWGGFGRGEEKVIEIILERMWELKKVGVAFWSCGHVKTREVLDPITGTTYTTLSTNMMQKYFNGIKTKMHIVGIACIDREIIKEKTGRKNIVTKEEITRNKVVTESRKIIFRDDDYGVDSKSRFANIVDEIPLDTDAFIKALQDAIANAKNREIITDVKPTPKSTPKTIVKDEEIIDKPKPQPEDEYIDEEHEEDEIDELEETEEINLVESVKELYKQCKDKELKAEIKEVIAQHGKVADVPTEQLQEIYNKLK